MSTAAAGPFFAVCGLLVLAGLAKLVRPAATARAMAAAGVRSSAMLARVIGAGEIVVAVAAIGFGSRPLALLVFAAYLAFAAFTLRLIARSDGQADCGCFGADEAPATHLHVALDLGAASFAALAALAPPGSIGSVLADQPLSGVPFLALVALCTWLGYLSYTVLPSLAVARNDGDGR